MGLRGSDVRVDHGVHLRLLVRRRPDMDGAAGAPGPARRLVLHAAVEPPIDADAGGGAMKARGPKSVNEYIAGFPRSVQAVLRRVRSTIRKAIPEAEEAISYQIPTYKLDGRNVLYFAGWKEHYSLYPSGARLVAAFKTALAPYEVNDKGTIRFPLGEPVPVKLIAGIARFRAQEVREARKAKASKKR